MTFTLMRLGLFSSLSPSARLCRRTCMKRRPLQERCHIFKKKRRRKKNEPVCLKAESSTCSSVCVCDITVSEHSPFQPHQGQRCSNFGPLSCVGLSLGLQYVLQGDVLLWILNIHSSNFLYRMHHIRSWWCGKKNQT